MQRQPDVYLELALLALRQVAEFIQQRSLQAYMQDAMCQSAVERQLEIAGDALGQLRKVAPDVFERISQGDQIVAFRNVLAHGYASLDHTRVYDAAALKAPQLLHTLEQLLSEFPDP
jgi:uncharacterized protein with HEPN domain